jgi:hypothetical protein
MKPLSEVFPDPKKVVDLAPEKLGQHLLDCISETEEPNIKRAIIAKTLSSNYHPKFHDEIAHAIETAIDWLIAQCLLGASPYDPNLIFLTQRGKRAATRYAAENPVDIA